MPTRKRPVRRKLSDRLALRYPDIDAAEAIAAGRVLVDGSIALNPDSLVLDGASVTVAAPSRLRGAVKLEAALTAFEVAIAGRVAVDLGAAAGGFTTVLLEWGAARVYAVDAGYGQLVGSLRQDPRVVVLERTNVGSLARALVPETVELLTLDLSYISVAAAMEQLSNLDIASGADLVALVKPMFELALPAAPVDRSLLDEAIARARAGVEAAGWVVVSHIDSPVRGARGARELFLHARRAPGRVAARIAGEPAPSR